MDSTIIDWDLLSSYAGLLSLATATIYCGSLSSLSYLPTERTNSRKSKQADDEDDDDEEELVTERMTLEDAWMFPLIGSVVLFGLYLILKYFGTDWINKLLGWYISIAGIASVWKASTSLTRYTLGKRVWNSFHPLRLSVSKKNTNLVQLSLRTISLFLLVPSALPSLFFTFSSFGRRSALLADVLALSFSFNALGMLKLDSFATGCMLLSGLFLYDIWWVFGTEVMVKVATQLDVPIKLLWPKSMSFATSRGFTMLGLGDVVIPGTFVALALRYDYHRTFSKPSSTSASDINNKKPAFERQFGKPYFYASLSAYVLGLVTTMSVMHVFGAAQPALLYLSPACILSFVGTALVRGELRQAWKWRDEPEDLDEAIPAKRE